MVLGSLGIEKVCHEKIENVQYVYLLIQKNCSHAFTMLLGVEVPVTNHKMSSSVCLLPCSLTKHLNEEELNLDVVIINF